MRNGQERVIRLCAMKVEAMGGEKGAKGRSRRANDPKKSPVNRSSNGAVVDSAPRLYYRVLVVVAASP
jgi:hypothetical protein